MHKPGDTFSTLVRHILMVEKKRSIRDVARGMDMEYVNLHARISGRARFKPEEIGPLIREVPDLRLCDFLLRNTGFIAVERPAGAATGKRDAFHIALRLANETLAALAEIGDAMAEGGMEASHLDLLRQHVNEAERAICGLRAHLPALARHIACGGGTPAAGQRSVSQVSPTALV